MSTLIDPYYRTDPEKRLARINAVRRLCDFLEQHPNFFLPHQFESDVWDAQISRDWDQEKCIVHPDREELERRFKSHHEMLGESAEVVIEPLDRTYSSIYCLLDMADPGDELRMRLGFRCSFQQLCTPHKKPVSVPATIIEKTEYSIPKYLQAFGAPDVYDPAKF